MDVLSEVLKAVKLDGAVFFHGEFSAPWCMREPDADTMASYLRCFEACDHFSSPDRRARPCSHRGEARPLSLIAGDLVIFPHGDAHVMGNGPPVKPVDSSTHLQQVLAEAGCSRNTGAAAR